MGREVVLGEIAAAGAHLARLAPAAGVHRHPGPDAEAVAAGGLLQAKADPVVARRLPVLEQGGGVVDVADHEVEVPVAVEVAHGQAAARLLDQEAGPGGIRHVPELPAFVEEELVLLPEGLVKLGEAADVGIDVAVGDEEVQPAVEVGVEEGDAPAHRLEAGRGQARGAAHVLEEPVAQVPVEGLGVVGEGGEHEVQPAVVVVVAGVHPHPRLGPPLRVDGDAAQEADALEPAVPAVVVEEVGGRVVGHEEVDPAVVVVVGGEDAEAVAPRRVREAVGVGGFHEGAVAAVLEEQVGFAGQPRGAHHHLGASSPGHRSLRLHDVVPGGAHVARHVEVEIAVAVGVEERAAGAPASRRDAGLGRHVRERPVAVVPEQEVAPPVRHVEVELPVVVEVAHAHAVAPGSGVDPRFV